MLDYLKTFHSLGLQDGEIFHSRTCTTVYEYAQGALKLKSHGIDEGFGVRVLKERKLGFSYCNSPNDLGTAIKTASSLSSHSTESPFSFAHGSRYEKPEVLDKRVENLGEKELKEIGELISEGVRKHAEPVRIFLVSSISESEIANTSPLYAGERSTSFAAFAEAKRGEGFGSADYSHFRMLESPEALGERAGLMAREMEHPKKPDSGKYSVIFSTDLLASLFSILSSSLSGEWRRRKISRLHDKEGAKLFSDKLTISDDPLADAESRSAFDGEGVASKKTTLIENGAVRNFYYSRECAAFSGLEKEGNCSRGDYGVQPGLGSSNTVVSQGKDAPEELGRYIFIESMHGLHTANALTGDFGAEASIAFLHEKGKKIPVRGFMVSGNLFDMFANVEAVGKHQHQSGSFLSPSIAFSNISVIS